MIVGENCQEENLAVDVSFPYEVAKSDAKIMLQQVHNRYRVTYSNKVNKISHLLCLSRWSSTNE